LGEVVVLDAFFHAVFGQDGNVVVVVVITAVVVAVVVSVVAAFFQSHHLWSRRLHLRLHLHRAPTTVSGIVIATKGSASLLRGFVFHARCPHAHCAWYRVVVVVFIIAVVVVVVKATAIPVIEFALHHNIFREHEMVVVVVVVVVVVIMEVVGIDGLFYTIYTRAIRLRHDVRYDRLLVADAFALRLR